MTASELATLFLFHFTFVGVFGALLARTRSMRLGITMLVAGIAGVAMVSMVGSSLTPGGNFAVQTAARLTGGQRPHLVAAALGVGLSMPWLGVAIPSRFTSALLGLALVCTTLVSVAVVGKDYISPYLPHPQQRVGGGAVNTQIDAAFELELLGELQAAPIRIAVHPTTGTLFVAGQIGIAAQSGAVMRIEFGADGRITGEHIVAPMLNRPFGMAFHGGDLYVSRSGQFTRWRNGKADQMNTGAVTVLKDLDGDGGIDYYHDVVTGLPGARAPDYLHQNNAIAFADDGVLYITSGISSDGHPARHPWEGTILRASPPDYSSVDILARGLRNTFGLAIGPAGTLFATDNDAQTGNLGGIGDKLLAVREGDDFGHPYAAPGSPGVSPPLAMSNFALAGIATSTARELPESYRDDLFVVSYGEGRVLRYELVGSGRAQRAVPQPFAVVPAATDIAAGPNGEFYVVSYEKRTLYRIRPR